MDNIRDMRFFDFDNRFPDMGTNEEIMIYLRELKSQLNMWQEKSLATTDALTLEWAGAIERISTLERAVAELEESDE